MGQEAVAEVVDYSVCRGMEHACRFSLKVDPRTLRDIKHSVANSALVARLGEGVAAKPRPHGRLRIGISACPNACSLPQIKTIGLIARRKPVRIKTDCNGCGACVERCTEGALTLTSVNVGFDSRACVGCGLCLNDCPMDLIRAEDPSFEVMVGGAMGRHPRLATSLGYIRPDQAASVVGRIVDLLAEKVQDGLSIPEALRKLDISAWRNHVFYANDHSTP